MQWYFWPAGDRPAPGKSPPNGDLRGPRSPPAAGGRRNRREIALGVSGIPPEDPGIVPYAVLPARVPRVGASHPGNDGPPPLPPDPVPAGVRSPEARHAVPAVGVGRRGPVRGGLDPRVRAVPVDGRFPGAHVHTPVDRLHPAGQCVHGAENGPVPDALPDPPLPPPLPGQRGVLVVLRVHQPFRRKLALRRRDGIRGGGIFPLRNPPVLHRPPGGPVDPRAAALLPATRRRVPRMAPPLSRKTGCDRPRRAAPLLRRSFRRRDRPRLRISAGLGRPAHAPDCLLYTSAA